MTICNDGEIFGRRRSEMANVPLDSGNGMPDCCDASYCSIHFGESELSMRSELLTPHRIQRAKWSR